MPLKIHISGLNTHDSILSAVKSGANYVSAVFNPKSARYILPDAAQYFFEIVPNFVKKVAIFNNASISNISKTLKEFKADYIQLEGFESLQMIGEIKDTFKKPIIKTIYVTRETLQNQINEFTPSVDMFLFHGSKDKNNLSELSDNVFDWSLLKKVEINRPWFLAGGLNKYNVKKAIVQSRAKMISVSSSLEAYSPGLKDPDLIKEFIKIARSTEM